ncbi:MAG: TIGR03617 family F420-dependent LLM class oxidoreductase [Dehalococcoidia bacterium]|nr:TIGR03617 family F420-dependent LLM class oxidoreductase [Dehalococcoidia bacterium]
MKVYCGIPQDLTKVPEAVKKAQEMGYDGVTSSETQHDPFFPLVVAAEHSQSVRLTTSVAIAFPRSPMVMANIAWDLQNYSQGRFILGMGTQVKGHNERRFSVPWVAPGPRLREYVLALRAIWDCWQNNTPLKFEGEHYHFSLMTPNFSPGPIKYPRPPVHIAAVGTYMCRLAGEVCDGLRPHGFTTPKYVQDITLPNLEAGAKKAGRSLKDLDIFGGGFMAVGADAKDAERLAEGMRTQIAFYGSTRTYHNVFELHGWKDIGPKLHEMSLKGQWSEMAKAVPDNVLEEFALVCTLDDVVAKVKKRYGGYATSLGLSLPTRTPQEVHKAKAVIQAIKAL